MFKKLIEPVQMLLLQNNKCVGCGRDLTVQKTQEVKGKTLVFCKCGRIFVKENNKFRRALFEEVR